jgi:hypothetical protein
MALAGSALFFGAARAARTCPVTTVHTSPSTRIEDSAELRVRLLNGSLTENLTEPRRVQCTLPPGVGTNRLQRQRNPLFSMKRRECSLLLPGHHVRPLLEKKEPRLQSRRGSGFFWLILAA